MKLLDQIGIKGPFAAIKRIGQTGLALYSVFLGPMPVPTQMAFWWRIVVAMMIVVSLPLVRAMKHPTARIWLSVLGVLMIVAAGWCGFDYWLALPTRTITVRGQQFVRGDITPDTLKALQDNQLRNDDTDLRNLIEGQANKEVEAFFTPKSVAANKIYLGIRYIAFLALGTIGIMILFEWMPEDEARPSAVNGPPAVVP